MSLMEVKFKRTFFGPGGIRYKKDRVHTFPDDAPLPRDAVIIKKAVAPDDPVDIPADFVDIPTEDLPTKEGIAEVSKAVGSLAERLKKEKTSPKEA